MGTDVVALEISGYDSDVAAVVSKYFTRKDASIRTSAADTPANTAFQPRAINAGDYEVFIYDDGTTGGRSRAGGGAVVLDNRDRGLDYLKEYGLDGRDLIIRTGTKGAAYPSAYTTRIAGTMARPEFTQREVLLKLRDNIQLLSDRLLVTEKYAGNNTLPNGVEGVEGDLQDKYKPELWGQCFEIPAPLVNTSKNCFQVSRSVVQSIDAVYDRGATVNVGSSHASLAALMAATVTAGTYDYYLGAGTGAGCYFRMGTNPTGRVTCDATAGANAAARTVAQISYAMLTGPGGVASGDIVASSVTALDTANSSVVGFWSGTGEVKVGAAVDEVMQSIAAFWAPNRAGKYRFGRLEAPSGSAVLNIKEYMILNTGADFEILNTDDVGRGIPLYEVRLEYKKIYQTQSRSDTAGVALPRQNYLEEAYRVTAATDATIQTKHLLAESATFQSLLTTEAAAATEATRRLDLYKVDRDYVKVVVPRIFTGSVELNDVVSLDLPYYDYNGGKNMRVVGLGESFNGNNTTLYLWG